MSRYQSTPSKPYPHCPRQVSGHSYSKHRRSRGRSWVATLSGVFI
ncbi:hypothetical protein RSAG8_13937, partial [Rhizoctonia solani AG-8 WAC10335]